MTQLLGKADPKSANPSGNPPPTDRNLSNEPYNLFTALAMVVGTVIGSGIFFKADDVLKYTGGNIWQGVIVFVLAAFAIIFGSLSFTEFARRSDQDGGLISYAEHFVSPHFSAAIGWFQTFLYFPTIAVVVSWVVGIFLSILLELQGGFGTQMAIGFVWLILSYALNILSAALAGKFQVIATFVKLLPLFIIGLLTFIKGDFSHFVGAVSNEVLAKSGIQPIVGLAWLGAVGPIAFAFDGWVVATSISGELKNAKRNLPLALSISPIIILIGYLVYFVGLSTYLGASEVIALGDDSVSRAATQLFGAAAGKLFLALVVVSVMGTVNGLVLGFIRLPYSLALSHRLPLSHKLRQISPRFNIPLHSAAFTFAICIFWFGVHYWTMSTGILGKMDISEISVVISYLLYVVFYFKVIAMWRAKAISSLFFGLIAPILAMLGSAFILFGGMQNPLFLPVCVPICLLVLGAAYCYSKKFGDKASGN